MEIETLSSEKLDIIEQYKNVPYFNNKTLGKKGGIAVEVGKGSAKEINEEIKNILAIKKVDINSLKSDEIKKVMVENNLGIDCSGFVYHVLGLKNKKIHFSRFLARFNPEKNTDVVTLTDDKNSEIVGLRDIKPGDIVTMISNKDNFERNHVILIYKIEYKNSFPQVIHYTHAVAWPTDGEYGHGIHTGTIEMTDINRDIVEQIWIENGKVGEENYTHARAKKSKTEIRRIM